MCKEVGVKHITVRPHVYAKLDKIAKQEKRTKRAVTTMLIETAFKKLEKGEKC